MSIFNILFRNTGQKARTLHPDDQSTPAGFRGALEHDSNLCIGCKTCVYVCSPGAITLETRPDGTIWWQYQTSRCTFCSRCAEYCPTRAIHLDATAPATALARQGQALESGESTTRHVVRLQRCTRCGQQYAAIPLPILQQLIEREISSGYNIGFDMAALMGLCEKCRSRVTSQRLKDSLTGAVKTSQR